MAVNVDIESSWKELLSKEFEDEYFALLIDKVRTAYRANDVWPKGPDIFNAFNHCKVKDVKVVIIGQDPYPTPGHAHGLCFSVQAHVRPFPKSLNNIFKEIKDDLGIAVPDNGNLERWGDQGVFLLNTVLTVNAGAPNSHKGYGWEKFTDAVIHGISEEREGLVFLLWGAHAQQKEALINTSKHTVLKSVHPSPLSAHRGFFGCKHFSKTNEILISQHQTPINW